MKKTLPTLLLLSLTLFSCSVLRTRMTSQTFEPVSGPATTLHFVPIYWQKDTLGPMITEKSAILLPVKIKGIDEDLFMQLDLGATMTMLYGSTLSAFCEKYPELGKDTIIKENYGVLRNAEISISDSACMHAARLYVKKDFGSDNIDGTVNIIGSLAYDIIGDNYLILDFKSDRIAISPDIPDELESLATFIEKADVDKFPIILPFRYGDKKMRLFYDTGSSRFPLLTGTKRLKRMSWHRQIQELDSISSWGEYIPVYGPVELKEATKELQIGPVNLGEVEIFGVKKMNKLLFIGSYLYGITGNEVFDDKILIVSRKHKAFGIIQ